MPRIHKKKLKLKLELSILKQNDYKYEEVRCCRLSKGIDVLLGAMESLEIRTLCLPIYTWAKLPLPISAPIMN